MSPLKNIQLEIIYRRVGARRIDPKKTARLAASMKVLGLKSPIEVRACQKVRNGAPADAFEIVTGQHRFEAARSLGWTEIDAFITDAEPDMRRLWEIDENLMRNAGTPAQQAVWHGEREAIMVKLGHATDRAGRPSNAEKSSAFSSYAKQTAKAVGTTDRTVRTHLARAKKIEPKVLAEVTGTELDKGVVLDTLAALPKPEQAAKLAEIKAEAEAPKPAPPARSVTINLQDRRIRPLVAQWNTLSVEDQDAFLATVGAARVQRSAA